IGDSRIYNDFFHSQTPYLPIVLSWWMGLAGDASPYLIGRAFNAFWAVAALFAIYVMRLSPIR
ncbi:MAG: hypothetical protein AAGL49_13995, partial [Pseudomonadota bacterium]